MFKIIKLYGQNLLVERAQIKAESEFADPGSDDRSPVFLIKFGSEDHPAGKHILVRPGEYPTLDFEGQKYFAITNDDVLGEVEKSDA